jgi:hypothetical protein
MYTKNLLLSKLLFFENKNQRKLPPSPPNSSILMPSEKYENFKRTGNDFVQKGLCELHSGSIIRQQHKHITTYPNACSPKPSLLLTHTIRSAGGLRTDRLAHSRAFLAAAAVPSEGIAELTASLARQLQQGSGVRGLLLHGVDGIGKTTLAAHIARSLQPPGAAAAAAAGLFAGGVYCVSIQAGADDNALAREQVRVLICRYHARLGHVSVILGVQSRCLLST